ncbi:MAG: GAF domain-containing protein [Bacteroidetes bacterium]|nr:GAF domain-containing protein [Bacteroidota bacterium]
MSEEIIIDKTRSDKEVYESLLPQVEALMSEDDHYLSNLSNFTAILKGAFDKISWVGFYLFDGKELYLGPFQGKLACTKIKIGTGVCGTSAEKRETIVVEDVHKFPGHIACDSGSNSEIVLPLVKFDKLIGVLDLDSYGFSSFNNIDKEHLEKLVAILIRKSHF